MENHKTNEFGFYFNLLSKAVGYADIVLEVAQEVAPAYKDFSEGKESSTHMAQVHRVINKILLLKSDTPEEIQNNRQIFMEVAHSLSGCDWLGIQKDEKAAIELMLKKLVIKNLDNTIDVLTTTIGVMKGTVVYENCYVFTVNSFSNLLKKNSLLINDINAGKLNLVDVVFSYNMTRAIIMSILVAAEGPSSKAIV